MVLVFQEESWRIVCCVSTLNPLDIFTRIMYQSHFICCVSNYSFETLCPFHWKNETIANAISSLKHFKIPLIHDASHLSKLHIQTNIRALITTTTLKGDFIMKSSKQTAKLENTMKKIFILHSLRVSWVQCILIQHSVFFPLKNHARTHILQQQQHW